MLIYAYCWVPTTVADPSKLNTPARYPGKGIFCFLWPTKEWQWLASCPPSVPIPSWVELGQPKSSSYSTGPVEHDSRFSKSCESFPGPKTFNRWHLLQVATFIQRSFKSFRKNKANKIHPVLKTHQYLKAGSSPRQRNCSYAAVWSMGWW